MKPRQKALLLSIASIATYNLQAQVGINTMNPDSSAALHIFHISKGVLLPTVDNSHRLTMTSNNKEVGNGLLVYDTIQRIYYFRDSRNHQWLALNPWRVSENTSAAMPWRDIRLAEDYRDKNVYIGANVNAVASAKLHVEGTFRAEGSITAQNGIAITGNATVSNNVIIGSNTTLSSGSATFGNTFINSGTVTATNIAGYGTIPLGGIIMWSGTTVPDGWALCNGAPSNGYTTPNLRGRFIVGYDPGDNDYKEPGNLSEKNLTVGSTGGERTHTLSVNEMPKHGHNMNIGWSGSESGSDKSHVSQFQGEWPGYTPDYTDIRSVGETGGSQPHENRPPYYVLAFIMRVK